MMEKPNDNERMDWSETLRQYEIPSVYKEQLLRPYFGNANLKEPILDAGCGTGYFSKILVERGLHVTGIDLNGDLKSGDNFTFQKADIVDYQNDGKFQTILLINILATSPVTDRLKMFKKIKELKTADGLAYVVNTNADLFGENFESENLSGKKLDGGRAHVRVKLIDGKYIEFDDFLVSEDEIKKMCKETGLQIVEKTDFKPNDLSKPVYELYLLK